MKQAQESTDKAPKFSSDFKDVEVEEEMEAKFKCKVKGDPLPDVKWFINDTEVTSEGPYVITYEEGKCTLTIKSVTRDMNGKVTCKVSLLRWECCAKPLHVRVALSVFCVH